MIFDLKYGPLWLLVDHSNSVNGFNPMYELQTSRLIYTIFILTLLGSISFLLASNKNKMCLEYKTKEEAINGFFLCFIEIF